MSESQENTTIRSRAVYVMITDDGSEITVDHVYLAEGAAGTCEHEGCGNPAHDPGFVSLDVLCDGPVLLSAEQALVLANRLTRAANLVLESEEDAPDIEREAARFSPAPASGQSEHHEN